MQLAAHSFQRAGAHAVAAMCDRPSPALVSPQDLDRVQEIIITDALRAAHAPKEGPGYAWAMALGAAFPNSPVAHPHRYHHSQDRIRTALQDQFAADDDASWYCSWCDAPAAQRWGKSLLPLAESSSHLNTAQGGVSGVPLCRPCRIAIWALPYAAYNNGANLVTVDTDDQALARTLTLKALERNRAAIDQDLAAWPRGWNTAWLAEALVERPSELISERWRNDNREPYLVRRVVDTTTARWWARLPEEIRAEVCALTAPKPVWDLLSQDLHSSPSRYHPFTLLHVMSYRAREAALEGSADADLRAWRLSDAVMLLLASGYAQERGVDTGPTEALVDQIAPLLEDAEERRGFIAGRMRVQQWRTWLERASVEHLLKEQTASALITAEQWDLLFGGEETFLHRDLLVAGVLLHHGHQQAPTGR